MMDTRCGCGREGRYTLIEFGFETYACNKYKRCPSYEELTIWLREAEQKRLRYKAVLENIVNINGMDYEYRAWAKEALK